MSLPLLYRGSVKDILGPLADGSLVFEYSDAYSVFDWGRMPDAISGKGAALACIAATLFEAIGRAEAWREHSASSEAHGARKGNPFGAAFVELGEELQKRGLRHHYLGACASSEGAPEPYGAALDRGGPGRGVPRWIRVNRVSAVRPASGRVLGREVYDYAPTRAAPAPRLVPLEVVFRFACPDGSSILERARKNPGYVESLGFHRDIAPGARWEFPLLELFTKLESSDRPVSLGEALALSGLAPDALEKLLFLTAWVAAFLRQRFARVGLELADGKLEWGISSDGLFLVDSIGPDELRLLSPGGAQVSKEFLRIWYRGTPWYAALASAKADAESRGRLDWKRSLADPPKLPESLARLAGDVYRSLANAIAGREVFPEVPPLDQVVARLEKGE